MPPPQPSPRGGGSKSGTFVLPPPPSGGRAGEGGTREATVRLVTNRRRACLLLGTVQGRGSRKNRAMRCPHPSPPPEGEGASRGFFSLRCRGTDSEICLAPSTLWGICANLIIIPIQPPIDTCVDVAPLAAARLFRPSSACTHSGTAADCRRDLQACA